MKTWQPALLLVVCCAIVACTAVKPQSDASAERGERPVSTPVTPSESLLAYYAGLRKLSGAELAKETQVVRQAFAKDKSDWLRLRLALLLSTPNNDARDTERSGALLDPLMKGPSDTSARNFALVLRALIGLRKDVEALQAVNKKLKEDLNDEQQRTQVLQQKLNTLQAIEKRTIDRDKASYPAKDK